MLHAGQTADGLGEHHGIFVRRIAGENDNGRSLHPGADLLVARFALSQLLKGEGERRSSRRSWIGRKTCLPSSTISRLGSRQGRSSRSRYLRSQQRDLLAGPVDNRGSIDPRPLSGEPGEAERVWVGCSF